MKTCEPISDKWMWMRGREQGETEDDFQPGREAEWQREKQRRKNKTKTLERK